MAIKMPREGAITFADLIGKLDLLRIACDKCGRDGCYGLNRLIERRGRDAKLIDWLDELTADCAKKRAGNMNILAVRSVHNCRRRCSCDKRDGRRPRSSPTGVPRP